MDEQQIDNDQLVYFRIGGAIRKYRKEKFLKLLDLAAISGIKPAMLSKIENGRLLPTIPVLFTVIRKLGISPESFFAELSADRQFPGYILLLKKSFVPYENEEEAEGFEYLSIFERRQEAEAFRISLLNLRPGASRPKVSTEAFEFIFILKGKIDFQLGENTFDMSAGDALYFDGRIPHVPVNKGTGQASIFVIYFFGKGK